MLTHQEIIDLLKQAKDKAEKLDNEFYELLALDIQDLIDNIKEKEENGNKI